MKVLFATSEAIPLVKTGGLADVSGALPLALKHVGVDCRLLLPGYHSVLKGLDNLTEVGRLSGLPNQAEARLLAGSLPGSNLVVYVLQLPAAFERPGGPYQDIQGHDHADNAWRFAAFSQAAAILASADSPVAWNPDVLHCNDWQTGLAPAYLHYLGRPTASVMTVHNLAFQGIFPPEAMAMTGLPSEAFDIHGLEYFGSLSYLKAGLFYADRLTTVSPSYAEEIQSEPLGMGMQGLLSSRSSQLTGIVNGIDHEEWDPSSDPLISRSFSSFALTGKKLCKLALQQELGLEPDRRAPIFGVIARMTQQKGLDMVLACADGIIARGGQLVMLGTGVRAIELSVREMVANHPGRAACFIGYDEALSHRIEAGADIFLMPSRFEPCGLNQMYSLRYGTVPIVHATGGLRDTVEDGVTGFQFGEASAEALRQAIERAFSAYADPAGWQRMMQAGMRRDFSWEKSAQQYAQVYRELLASRG